MEIELNPSITLNVDSCKIEEINTELPASQILPRIHPEWLENLMNFPIQLTAKPSFEQYTSFPAEAREVILVNHLLLAFAGTATPPFFSDGASEHMVQLFDESTISLLAKFWDLFCNVERISYFINKFEINSSPTLSLFAQSLHQTSHNFHQKLFRLQHLHDSAKGPLTLLELQIKLSSEMKLYEQLATICESIETDSIYEAHLINLMKQTFLESITHSNLYCDIIVNISRVYFEGLKEFLLNGDTKKAVQCELPIVESEVIQEESTEWFLNGLKLTKNLPEFLAKPHIIAQILRTGRNMQILKRCSKSPKINEGTLRLSYYPSFDVEQKIIESVRTLYKTSSDSLFDYFTKDKRIDVLINYLTSFYFMKSSDWVIEFIKMNATQLLSKNSDLSKIKLSFEACLRRSAFFKNNMPEINFELAKDSLLTTVAHLSREGIDRDLLANSCAIFELIGLDVNIEYPFVYILDASTMRTYNMIFKRLFTFTFVNEQLNQAWMNIMKLQNDQMTMFSSHIYDLILFFTNILFYFSSVAISSQFKKFINEYFTSTDVEGLINAHKRMILTISHYLFLDSFQISRILDKILDKTILVSKMLALLDESDPQLSNKLADIITVKSEWGLLTEDLMNNAMSGDSTYDEFILHLFGE